MSKETGGIPLLEAMDLRDYMAAKALQAFLSNSSIMKTAERADKKKVSECAYEFADAMLEARGQ